MILNAGAIKSTTIAIVVVRHMVKIMNVSVASKSTGSEATLEMIGTFFERNVFREFVLLNVIHLGRKTLKTCKVYAAVIE